MFLLFLSHLNNNNNIAKRPYRFNQSILKVTEVLLQVLQIVVTDYHCYSDVVGIGVVNGEARMYGCEVTV